MAYIKIPVTPAMERDYKECVAMEAKGQEKDCSGCSLSGGNQECLANNEWVKDDKTSVLPEIKDPEVLQKAISKYGNRAQVDMAIEEMSELTKALLKYRRGYFDATADDLLRMRRNIIEEAADVLITVAQVVMIYNYDNEIQAAVDLKVNRLRDRLGSAPAMRDTVVCRPSDYNPERVLSRIREVLSTCDEISDQKCQNMFCSDCKLERIERAINEG